MLAEVGLGAAVAAAASVDKVVMSPVVGMGLWVARLATVETEAVREEEEMEVATAAVMARAGASAGAWAAAPAAARMAWVPSSVLTRASQR